MLLHFVKFVVRYRTLFCCVVLTWVLGIVFGVLFLTSWNASMMSRSDRTSIDIHTILQRHTVFDPRNPKVARALKYCSPLWTNGRNHEGEGIPGSKLESVVVLMRHGDRGPIQEFVNLTSINCSVNRTSNPDFDQFAAFASAHQDGRALRDPFRRFPAVPRGNVCVPSQLSEWGALQQLRTGQLLRNAYRQTLLTKDWALPEHLVATSTFYERTYQSAVALLYGLLPKFDFVSGTIKAGLGSSLCYSQHFCNCPLLDKLRTVVDKEKLDHVAMHPAVLSLVQQLSSVLQSKDPLSSAAASGGRGSPSAVQPDTVFEQLLVYVCHRVALPCRHEAACITNDQLNNVVSYLEWRGKQLAKSPRVQLLSRLSMQGLLADILHKLDEVRSSKKRHRLVLYSAHDKTLMPLMVALGIYDGVRPPYSSRLVWELYSQTEPDADAASKVYHLKMLYNGKDVTKRVAFCAQQRRAADGREADGPQDVAGRLHRLCLFSSFVYFVNRGYLHDLNATSFKQACSFSTIAR